MTQCADADACNLLAMEDCWLSLCCGLFWTPFVASAGHMKALFHRTISSLQPAIIRWLQFPAHRPTRWMTRQPPGCCWGTLRETPARASLAALVAAGPETQVAYTCLSVAALQCAGKHCRCTRHKPSLKRQAFAASWMLTNMLACRFAQCTAASEYPPAGGRHHCRGRRDQQVFC